MDLTYTSYFRDSANSGILPEVSSKDIIDYRPEYIIDKGSKYTVDHIEDEDGVSPVVSEIKEINIPRVSSSSRSSSKSITRKFASKEEFKDTLIPIYETLLIERGLNPVFAKSLVAQDGLESAWGSRPSGDFNFGGIKGRGTTKRTREVINGKDVYINDSFRDFSSLEDFAKYKIDLLSNSRYRAFSGDVSEFSSRVSRGGYATDPNYSKLLNKVISSIKHGGVLKFQEGGILEGKEWVKNWYLNRRPLLKRNMVSNQRFPAPVTENFIYNELAHNINLTEASVDPKRVPEDAKGVYYPIRRKIYMREDSPSTAVHEWTHSSGPEPQIREIKKLQRILGDTMYDQGSVMPDEYLDDAAEIYSRLMQFRYSIGADPDHKFTTEEVDELKKKHIVEMSLTQLLRNPKGNKMSTTIFDRDGKVKYADPIDPEYEINHDESTYNIKYDDKDMFNILNRYSTDAVKRLLNEVAQGPNEKRSTLYAKIGLKVPKYKSSGVLKNAIDDPEHYYDYSRGKYDSKSGHWYDRNPESGLELKNTKHPTAFMHHEAEKKLGNKRYQDNTGRYYTFPEKEAPLWRNAYGVLSETPGLKEVGYPSYGDGKTTMEESIKDNLPRIKWIWDRFIEGGATKEQAAAILGNFWKENRIQYNIASSDSGAYGLPQLLGQRYTAYKEYLDKNNLADSTESQIKYAIPIIFGDKVNPHNLTNTYTYGGGKHTGKYNSFWNDWSKSQRKAFRESKGLDNITIAFANNFERMGSEEADYDTRKRAAKYIYNLMINR